MHAIVHFATTGLEVLGSIGLAMGMMILMRRIYDTIVSTVVTGSVVEWRKKGQCPKAVYHARVSYADKSGTEHTVLGTTPESERDVRAHPLNEPCQVRYVTQSPAEAELEDGFMDRWGYYLMTVAIGMSFLIFAIWVDRAIG